jgi:hypothetical protein
MAAADRRHDVHLCIAGTCLAALHYCQSNTPFLAWVASDWHGDRVDRVKGYSPVRKLLNEIAVAPVSRAMEKKVLASGEIIALRAYTKSELNKLLPGEPARKVVTMPIDIERFAPVARTFAATVGFLVALETHERTPLVATRGGFVGAQVSKLESAPDRR